MARAQGERRKSLLKSCMPIAKLLDSEGFSPEVASMVRRYAARSLATVRQRQRWRETRKAFSLLLRDKQLTTAEKLLVGKFIAIMQRISFDTGLRIGLTAFMFGARLAEEEAERLGDRGWNEANRVGG